MKIESRHDRRVAIVAENELLEPFNKTNKCLG